MRPDGRLLVLLVCCTDPALVLSKAIPFEGLNVFGSGPQPSHLQLAAVWAWAGLEPSARTIEGLTLLSRGFWLAPQSVWTGVLVLLASLYLLAGPGRSLAMCLPEYVAQQREPAAPLTCPGGPCCLACHLLHVLQTSSRLAAPDYT